MNGIFWAAFGGGAAAGLFTFAAVVLGEWFRWFIDRPLLKVSASQGFTVSGIPGVTAETSEFLFYLQASNPHSRSVTVSSMGVTLKGKKAPGLAFMPTAGFVFPFEVHSGKSLSQGIPMSTVADGLMKTKKSASDLKHVWFLASTGKKFRARFPSDVKDSVQDTIQTLSEEAERDSGTNETP